MTLMLASVLSPAEADAAVERGADIIDCKDPSRGALGALPLAEVSRIVEAVRGRRPVSAVVELPHDVTHARDAIEAAADAGAAFVKFALPLTPDAEEIIAELAPVAARRRLVAVLFADLGPDFGVLDRLAEAGFEGAMLDTAHKGKGRLLDAMSVGVLAEFVGRCRALKLTAGLAGSLESPDVPRLLVMAPDVLGFRGALCAEGERRNALSASAVSLIRDLIPRGAPSAAEPGDHAGEVDHVFVRDLVMPMEIGAYGFERGHTQRVRFSVEVEVFRTSGPDDMRMVFSYDVVMDAIKIILASGHIELVETIAERLAESILLHERARAVTVEVEKLDVVPPASVGVRIRRARPASVAAFAAGSSVSSL
ncbi:(5-formylfuran-3-yl)methyl phosphate synthase [Methylocystis heyeri]|uniref:(5-formylfuran-3-yl)methyl phosphate synthase n=1 Tax=Methylocystis heyeri TaxID=391905 RepID=A0A6B8KGM6_9HYPH|nr:(5-formylfuran-3-yl)methyl phosphate synthase [Methylocystis heyeri]QGM47496.1 dihydroneopterin aldolase [Methylocystis heyeri]